MAEPGEAQAGDRSLPGPIGGTRTDGDVTVVGDLMVDVVATVDAPIAFGSDTPAHVDRHGGGSAANTASWLGALGIPVRLVAAVGDDASGRAAITELERVGVHHVGPVVAGIATGTCIVVVDRSRERTMFPDRGANAHLDRFDSALLDDEPMARLHLSGYALLGDGSRDTALRSIERARTAGAVISVDAASAAPLRELGADRFLDWVHGIDELFANDDEVDALGGESRILESCRTLIHKHGARGVTWTNGIVHHRVAAHAVDARDSTGAGDAFAAGWLAAAHRGQDVVSALEAAVEVAARVVTMIGARPPLPPAI